MKKVICYLTLFVTALSFSQTKVGNVQFNDVDVFDQTELMLNGAGEREKLYAIGLYLDFEVNGVEDGIKVAEKDATMAVTIKAKASIDSGEFKEIIRNGIERATDGNSYQFENQIRDFINILPNEVNRYDIFKILYKKGGDIILFKNQKPLGKMNSVEFKKALFKIWLGENPVDMKLKEDLLASYDPNPILGRWKTFDKNSGVAISIVQLYIIKNMVYGSIEQMMRHSEKDDICYDCKGDDKNQKVEGLVIVKKLEKKGDRYINGKFTNVKNGEVYDCQMWVDEDNKDVLNVKLKGGGGTHVWRRVKQ